MSSSLGGKAGCGEPNGTIAAAQANAIPAEGRSRSVSRWWFSDGDGGK